MAAADVLAIVSSPLIPRIQCGVSHGAISPASSFARPRPTLKSGSRASQIPLGAQVGFCSANEFAKAIEGPVVDLTACATTVDEEGDCDTASASTKALACERKTEEPLGDGELKSDQNVAARKPKAKKNTKPRVASENGNGKRASGSKKRQAKSEKAKENEQDAERQSKLEPNITKIGSAIVKPGFKLPPTLAHLESGSDDIATSRTKGNEGCVAHSAVDLDLGLERATTRRRSWTPLQETVISPSAHEGLPAGLEQGGSTTGIADDVSSTKAPKFPADLQELYGYNEQAIRPKAQLPCTLEDQEPAPKRRRVSTASTTIISGPIDGDGGENDHVSNEPPLQEPATKAKKRPAKSSRTVTGIAIAQFNGSKATESLIGEADMSNAAPTKPITTWDNLINGSSKKPARKKSKATTAFVKPQILSPEALRRRLTKQEVLFGTSSQLALEEPATAIRDLQLALKESECINYATEGDSVLMLSAGMIYTTHLGNATRRAKNGIWSVSARYADDEILYEASQKDGTLANESFLDIDATLPLANAEDSPQHADHIEQDIEHSSSTNADSAKRKIKLSFGARSIQRSSLKCIGHTSTLPIHVPVVQRALIHTETEAAPNTGKQGPTPIPERAKPVEEPAPAATEPKTKPARKRKAPKPRVTAENPVKKPRGRPRKHSEPGETVRANAVKKPRGKSKTAKTTAASKQETEDQPVKLEDIEDSEPEPSSPPRRSSPVPAPALELSPSKRARAKAEAARAKAAARLEALEARLFPLITRAVKSGPRSTDPQNPSWYEKMLLYDPIVLEDFTAWLNDGPLKDAGWTTEDGEVLPLDVQNWCEKNSVCCIWRDSLRGWRSKRT